MQYAIRGSANKETSKEKTKKLTKKLTKRLSKESFCKNKENGARSRR